MIDRLSESGMAFSRVTLDILMS